MMKITVLVTALFLKLCPMAQSMNQSQSPEDILGLSLACQEIKEKSKQIAENLISAREKMQEDTYSWDPVPKMIDTFESTTLRHKANQDIESLSDMVKNLVLIDAETISKNLWRFPTGVVVERRELSFTEPMTIFFDFTNLGVCSLILNSLRDKDHKNYTRYCVEKKIEIAKRIREFSATLAHQGSTFLQPIYHPQGDLFSHAADINKLAQSLIEKNFADK